MSSRMISARDSDGELVWFNQSCARGWAPTCFNDGPLYYRPGHWILMAGTLDILEQPEGKVVEPDAALAWLVRNGYELPAEILSEAKKRQI